MTESDEILQEVLIKIGKENHYEPLTLVIKPFSSDGANFTSHLYLSTLSSPGKHDLNLFAKVAAVGEQKRPKTRYDIFKTETNFYKEILPLYKAIEEKYNVPKEHRLKTCTYYGGNEVYLKEILILEDLTSKGFQPFDRFKPIDWNYASESVKQLTIFHALSIALSKYNPRDFKKTERILAGDFDKNDMIQTMKSVLGDVLKVVKDENKDRLSNFLENKIQFDEIDDFLKPLRVAMIIHADYRLSNLMRAVNDDGTVKIIPLDYQCIRLGSPLVDLLYLIFTGSDKEFRDKHFTSTVELYYNELCDALRRFEVNADEVYSRDDFDYEYNKLLPGGLLMSVFTLLFVTVDADKVLKADNDLDLNNFALQPSEVYKTRIINNNNNKILFIVQASQKQYKKKNNKNKIN